MPTKRNKKPVTAKTQGSILTEELTSAFAALLSIEGVEGVGQPVTVIDPGDLRLEFLGFIERLRGGSIELDEEMLLITIPVSSARRRRKNPALDRLRKALLILSRYAIDKDVSIADVLTLFDETKRKLRQLPRRKKPR